MNEPNFRKLVYRTPFHPVRITLDSGESVTVRHPERIGVVQSWVMAAATGGPLFFEVERVVSVQSLRNGNGHRRR